MLHTKLSQPNDLKLFGVEVEGVIINDTALDTRVTANSF